jgi:hypothetical protein
MNSFLLNIKKMREKVHIINVHQLNYQRIYQLSINWSKFSDSQNLINPFNSNKKEIYLILKINYIKKRTINQVTQITIICWVIRHKIKKLRKNKK